MLREMATPEMVAEWKRTWARWRTRLLPNRKSGAQLYSYLRMRYPLREQAGECYLRAIRDNVMQNGFSREKLAPGESPRPLAFVVENTGAGSALYAKKDALDGDRPIFVGIDLSTGEFQVEGSAALWDELFAFRGLDAADLDNPFLVAQYVALTEKKEQNGARSRLSAARGFSRGRPMYRGAILSYGFGGTIRMENINTSKRARGFCPARLVCRGTPRQTKSLRERADYVRRALERGLIVAPRR